MKEQRKVTYKRRDLFKLLMLALLGMSCAACAIQDKAHYLDSGVVIVSVDINSL